MIARSAELRIFLEERGELSNSQTWLALHSPTPTWIQGVQRLLKQIVGKQAITPAPSEAARATTASHDVVRSVREALHSYRSKQYAPVHCIFLAASLHIHLSPLPPLASETHSNQSPSLKRNHSSCWQQFATIVLRQHECKLTGHMQCCRDINLPDREQEVRRRSDLVRVLVSSVNGIAHATSAAQRLANERLNVAGGLGRTFMHLAAFEAATAHPLEADEAEKFGNGCQTVCTSAREEMTPAVASCKVLFGTHSVLSAAASTTALCSSASRSLAFVGFGVTLESASSFEAVVCMQELEEQARMLGGALTALSARDEALRTARTLDDDLGRLRARAESMQASGHTKAVRLLCLHCPEL